MKKTSLLGGLSPAQFLREYWHKKPLLIRQALPGFASPVPRDALFALAARDDVESRLVSLERRKWRLARGPLPELPALSRKQWTLLVQGVNLHDDRADALLQLFRFLPDARLDDLMISYATDGGGVGPHFDSYDVFLLQAQGQRRWRISAQKNLELEPGLPLKILKDFEQEQEFVLNPGDMLYLPPHYAHDGVAIGECITCSIGFRAPSYQELGEAFLQFMSESIDLSGRYADPDLAVTSHPARLTESMIDRVAVELQKIRFDRHDIAIFLGEYMTEPKPATFFDPPERTLSPARFLDTATRRGVVLSSKTRMLYQGKNVFINGESFVIGKNDGKTLQMLANARSLEAAAVEQATADVRDALYEWYLAGWLQTGKPPARS